jgi:hypothetical protein
MVYCSSSAWKLRKRLIQSWRSRTGSNLMKKIIMNKIHMERILIKRILLMKIIP